MHAATWLFTSLSGARVSSSRLRIAVVPRSRACYLSAASGQWRLSSVPNVRPDTARSMRILQCRRICNEHITSSVSSWR